MSTNSNGKRKFLIKITVMAVLLFIIGTTIADPNEFHNFEGSTHGGCHGTNPESTTGYIELNSSAGVIVLPREVFTISARIKSFTEGASKTVNFGFADGNPGRGDNEFFVFDQLQYDSISIDSSGNSGIINFQVTAPSSFGNYTLIADTLEGGEGDGSEMFEWATGSINILIGFPSVPGAPILENLTSSFDDLELGQAQSFQIDAFDNETSVDRIFIEFNGANHSLIGSEGNTYIYNSWTPSSIGPKSYIIYAFDTENKLSGAGGSFTVQDTVIPVYNSYTKSADTIQGGEIINIYIVATDLAGIKRISIEFNSVEHLMAYTGNNSWSYELKTPAEEGSLLYTISIEDNSGNIETIDDSIQVTGGNLNGNNGNNSSNRSITILLSGLLGGMTISLVALLLKRKKHFF